MRTKETTSEKNDIEALTEEIRNLRVDLRASKESIKTLSKTVNALQGNYKQEFNECKQFKYNKKRKETKPNGKAPLREGDRVRITNKIKQHINVATVGDRVSTVTEVLLNRAKGYPNKIFITTDNGKITITIDREVTR